MYNFHYVWFIILSEIDFTSCCTCKSPHQILLQAFLQQPVCSIMDLAWKDLHQGSSCAILKKIANQSQMWWMTIQNYVYKHGVTRIRKDGCWVVEWVVDGRVFDLCMNVFTKSGIWREYRIKFLWYISCEVWFYIEVSWCMLWRVTHHPWWIL